MSGISSGVGLASGINTGQIIEQLLAIDARAKTPIQSRVSQVQSSKTALLDVNARLLGIRSASTKFRVGRVFDQMGAKVGDESVLTAVAKPGTPTGSYTFNVTRLVSASQSMTRGFASADSAPAGLTEMRFEFGDAAIARPVMTSALRGGQGIGQGSIKLTDAAGQSTTIDMSDVVVLDDVVTKINQSGAIGVQARIEGERLVLRDTTGGSGPLMVSNVGSGTIATALGITGSFASGVATGALLNGLGMNSALSELNDGNGVLVRDGSVDFRITEGSTTYDISLGRKNQPITATTKLVDLNNGVGVRVNSTDADDLTIVTSTGVSVGVNLGAVVVGGEVQSPPVTTVGELITRVNSELSGALGSSAVQLSIRSDAKGFQLTDTLGGTGPLKVLATGPNGNRSAKDLGIYTGPITTGATTITGQVVQNRASVPRATSIQDLADRVLEQTSGKVRVEVNSAGTGIRLVSTTGSSLSVLPGIVDGSSFGTAVSERTARDLGIFGLTGATSVEGTRITAGIATVRTTNLNGGGGLAGAGDLTLKDRSGATVSLTGLEVHDTLDSLVTAINTAASAAGVGVKLSLSDNGHSLVATDTSSGSGVMELSGVVADKLGIAGTSANATRRGNDLDRAYMSLATQLSSLNFGKGVGTGTFRITDSTGQTALVDVSGTETTLYDVMQEINTRGLAVEARLNSTGDGLLIVDTNTGVPATGIEIRDTTGTVARSLGIAKKASTPGGSIDGSFERVVTFLATDSLNDVVSKIKSAGVGVSAAVINTGAGANPFRLSLTSQAAGSRGQLLVDAGSVDLGLVRTTEGRDAALVLNGGVVSDAPFVFTSASNTFEGLLSGLQLTAKKTGTTTVEVTRDVEGMVSSVQAWAKSINDTISKIADYDKYDSTTKTKGPLFGNSTVSIVRQQLLSLVQSKPRGVTGQYQLLSQIGIRVGAKSQVSIDEDALRRAIDTDIDAVKDLFAGFQIEATGSTSPVAGVEVQNTRTIYSKLGVGDSFDQLVQRLTNSIDGTTSLADRNFQKQLDGLKGRLDSIDARLASKRTRYERQFAAMERAIARTQSQQSAVMSIPSSF